MEPFAGRRLSQVREADLVSLIDNGVPESVHLDYKQALDLENPNKDKARNSRQEFLRDLTALANADGGLLLFGVSERREGNVKTGLPEAILGIDVMNEHSYYQLIDQLLRDGVDEPLPGTTEVQLVRLSTGKCVLAVRCSKSHRAPHMVTLGGVTEFRVRTNTGTEPMSTAQIRDAVLQGESEVERARLWCQQQEKEIAAVLGGRYWTLIYVPLRRGPGLLDLTNDNVLGRLRRLCVPALDAQHQHYASDAFCFEGFRRLWREVDQERVTVYRSGPVVYQGNYSIRDHDGRFNHWMFERAIRDGIHDLVGLMRDLVLPWPGHIALVLAGVQGMSIARGDWNFERDIHEHRKWPHRFELDRIGPIETAVVDPTEDPDTLLRPLLDVIWNAANYAQCPGFDANGKYAGY